MVIEQLWQSPMASRHAVLACATSLLALLFSCSPGPLGPATAPSVPQAAEGVADGKGVIQLALGAYHSCALFDSGHVACWGDNRMGQLGNASDQRSVAPLLVAGLDDVVEIWANNATTCARKRAGSVLCWGANPHGEAYPVSEPALQAAPTPWGAYDSTGEPPSFAPANVKRMPTEIPQLAGAQGLSMGIRHGCALYADGRVICWGDASLGELGPGASPDAYQLQTVPGLPPLVEIASAGVYVRASAGCFWCILRPTHELVCDAAAPAEGQLGLGEVSMVAAGEDHACAVRLDGSVWCWGSNARGELGRQTGTGRDPEPAPVQWSASVGSSSSARDVWDGVWSDYRLASTILVWHIP